MVGVAGFEPATPTSRTWCAASNRVVFQRSSVPSDSESSRSVARKLSASCLRLADDVPGRLGLEVRVMVPVDLLQRLGGHPEESGSLPQIGPSLHEPRRGRMPK